MSFSFRDPWFLLLLLPVFAAWAWSVHFEKYRKAALSAPFRPPSVDTAREAVSHYLPFWLRFLALVLLVIALARPQRVERGEVPPAEGVDIMLLLDTSYSMAAEDFSPNRLEAAKAAALEFIAKRPNDRIGAVVFGGVAALSCPLTLDHGSLAEFIAAASINMTRAEGTAIGDAIITGVNHTKDGKAKSKVMVLLTDGRSNTGLIQDPQAAARTAAAFGIKIYTVGTASKGQAKIPTGDPMQPYAMMADDLDDATLMAVAGLTGGQFYRAKNLLELQGIYSKIDELEKTGFEAKALVSRTDAHGPPLAAGALLFALAFLLERTLLRRIP